jgi:murein DD-endopeptidase MepM/ murein hydrolase activator NlpD
MAPKHWTILIVPPGTGEARTIQIGPRARQAILGTAITAGILVIAAVTILFTPYGTPSARLLAAQNARLQSQLDQIGVRLASLSDTLAALDARDQQIRLLAGLPTEPASTVTEGPVPGSPDSTAGLADAPGTHAIAAGGASSAVAEANTLPKPFAGRLKLPSHADIDVMIARASELSQSFRAVSDTLTKNFERLASTPSIMPTTGWLSSQFSQSRFHPVLHQSRPHEGIDLSAPMGAPIIAPASGRVISVSNEAGYGNTFQIDHGNGIVTKFAHCSRIVVHVGQQVTRGQLIATVGNTGLATGPHLHYEVHVNGKPVDPLKYVLPEKVAY